MSNYFKGAMVRFTATIANLAGALTNPTSVTFKLKSPSGTVSAVSAPVNDSTGVYHVDAQVTESGDWFYRWEASGSVVGATEGKVSVNLSRFS